MPTYEEYMMSQLTNPVAATQAPAPTWDYNQAVSNLFSQGKSTLSDIGSWIYGKNTGATGTELATSTTDKQRAYQDYLMKNLGYTATEAQMATPNANGVSNYTMQNIMAGKPINTNLDAYGVQNRPDANYYTTMQKDWGYTPGKAADPTQQQLANRGTAINMQGLAYQGNALNQTQTGATQQSINTPTGTPAQGTWLSNLGNSMNQGQQTTNPVTNANSNQTLGDLYPLVDNSKYQTNNRNSRYFTNNNNMSGFNTPTQGLG